MPVTTFSSFDIRFLARKCLLRPGYSVGSSLLPLYPMMLSAFLLQRGRVEVGDCILLNGI